MECPKDKTVTLVDVVLSGDLDAHECPRCQGNWISSAEYERWQADRRPSGVSVHSIAAQGDFNFRPSEFDSKAALCPECKRYMTRARVMVDRPFYIERCPNCNGIWCDRGEWEILEALGLHESIEQLFSGDWQAQMRSLHHNQKERQATIEKLGPEVAQMVFDLAEVLENHPNGEFGVAYLMRRFDRPQEAAGDRATNPPPSLF
ncbi:MAG: hypothetical protein D6680_16035 [Cyanobacteria bacterium J007]|nr:MAG: hypothetical protein D6680_16035 [Cyanobacteria bacterium J007]